MGDFMKKLLYITINFKRFLSVAIICVISFAFVFLLDMVYIRTSASAETSASAVNTGLPVVIIDSGHGGEDGGTSSSSGIIEKDINLQISKKLESLFLMSGFKTIMTREDDRLIYDSSAQKMREKKVSDIHNRMNIINENPNSIFLSIHQNHFEQSKYYGTQVFYSKNNPESEIIAGIIQDNVRKYLQNENERQIKPSGTEIFLLHNAKSPAVMVECGFLSNPGEAQKLTDDDYQTEISVVIYQSIIEYLSSRM